MKFRKENTRTKILRLIANNPGLHLSKIADMLNIRISLAEYHLGSLERDHLITSVTEAGYRRFYIVHLKITYQERKKLSTLRQETPLQIVFFLLKHPYSTHKEILANMKIGKSTLSYQLQKLISEQIISMHTKHTEKTYKIINEKEILRLISRFKPYEVLESFKDIWSDFTVD